MVTNIVEAIQQKLGYRPLKKVDPNTQEIKEAYKMSPEEKLPQAAIPAVLAAAIKYSDGKDGINLLSQGTNENWLNVIYCGKENDAIQKVADYAGIEADEARRHMQNISNETVTIVRDVVKAPNAEKLRSFMNSQRHSILSHLPAALKMGDVLNEETFDDRTNKMEGPVSSFLHRIEDII
ncbi:MAG TPA: hypothetical protein VFP87_09455 [Chitinophagaceae bacterium]|nr:hypothetical protein [Chitinophagaceae bacterium]